MAYVDWRTPGCVWHKTETGWKTTDYTTLRKSETSIASNENDINIADSNNRGSNYYLCISTFKNSRESSFYNSLGDAMKKLDLRGALYDHSRFVYVCRIIEEIAKHKLSSLAHSSIKYLFELVEQAVAIAIKRRSLTHEVKSILITLLTTIEKERYNLIGSLLLWKARTRQVHAWQSRLKEDISIKGPDNDKSLNLMDLPDDCLRHILEFFSDCRDITMLSATNRKFNELINESFVWRHLCQYHFENEWIEKYLNKGKDWKQIFKLLYRKFGLRQLKLSESLFQCHQCGFVYWKQYGHPCSSPLETNRVISLSPKKLLSLFSC